MHTHVLQHVPFEGLGSIAPWLQAAGHTVSSTRLFETDAFPAQEAIDFLIVLGGPMSVNDEKEYPWLVREKTFIQRAIESEKPVLGVCLGAQLIANTAGASVYRNAEKEIGWLPIAGLPSPADTRIRFPASTTVFHWHGETFDLPSGALHLARSQGCHHQAFQLGAAVIGLQFHLETTPESAHALVAHCRHELTPSRYVQTEKEILAAPAAHYSSIHRLMAQLLTRLLSPNPT